MTGMKISGWVPEMRTLTSKGSTYKCARHMHKVKFSNNLDHLLLHTVHIRLPKGHYKSFLRLLIDAGAPHSTRIGTQRTI